MERYVVVAYESQEMVTIFDSTRPPVRHHISFVNIRGDDIDRFMPMDRYCCLLADDYQIFVFGLFRGRMDPFRPEDLAANVIVGVIHALDFTIPSGLRKKSSSSKIKMPNFNCQIN